MGPNQGVADWVRNRAQQVADALASGAWSLKPSGDTKTLHKPAEAGLILTRRTLDFAIGGAGYFLFRTSEGIAGSRDGRLQLDGSGRLCNDFGHLLDMAFTIPSGASHLLILRTGEVITQSHDGLYSAPGILHLGKLTEDGWKRGEPATEGFGPVLQGALGLSTGSDETMSSRLSNRHTYRQPAAGAGLTSTSGRLPKRKVISSQQVAALVERMLKEKESEIELDPSSKNLVEVLVRLAVNRLSTGQASELRRSLKLSHLEGGAQ